MDWLSDKEITQLWVTIIGGLIAGLAVLLVVWLFKAVTPKVFWDGVGHRLKVWYNKIRLYIRLSSLSSCDRDILKALYDSDTTQLSLRYDDGLPPIIQTKLDRILDIPVACRLMVSIHYTENLEHLVSHGLLRHDAPWRYRIRSYFQVDTRSYQLTEVGKRFICNYDIGNKWRKRFIRKWIIRLDRHKYKGHYIDKIGNYTRRKLPNLLRGVVYHKVFYSGASSMNTQLDRDSNIDIYEYPLNAREDGVECMVVIHRYPNIFNVKEGDRVFLLIHTDETLRKQECLRAIMWEQNLRSILATPSTNSVDTPVIPIVRNQAYGHTNKPLYLDTDPKLKSRFDTYSVKAVVISILGCDDPVCTILNLGHTQPFDLDLENERYQSVEH